MLSSILFTALISILSLVFDNATPARARLLSGRNYNIEDSYIVKLKAGTNITNHIDSLPFPVSVEDENSPVTHWWPGFFKGYSGIFVGADLDAILASPDVEYVEKDGIVTGADSQTKVPWNLQAISTRRPVGGTNSYAMSYTYLYNQPIGQGVDIYIIDSGVYTEHDEFEGRARFGWAVPGLGPGDGHGHGTHVAGIAAGKTYGVAKKANIVAVRFLNEYNEGNIGGLLDGIDWVLANVQSTRRPSIACLAVSTPHHEVVTNAINLLVDSGVTVVGAAGNEGIDASNTSPGSARAAIIVGSSDIVNDMDPSSNYGLFVDLFAPGINIASAGITGRSSSKVKNGTSSACAHVAGVAASLLSMNPRSTPLEIFGQIMGLVTKNAINWVGIATVSSFVYNGFVP